MKQKPKNHRIGFYSWSSPGLTTLAKGGGPLRGSRGRGLPTGSKPEGKGPTTSPPSYVVGILLSPLFLASCMSSPRQGPVHPAPNASSDLLQMLPVALAVSGVQASLLRITGSSLPLLLLSGATWLAYPLFWGPLEAPLSCSWVGLGALTLNLLMMSCWHKEGQSDLSFSEASSLSQLFAAAAFCFVAGNPVGAPIGGPPYYPLGGAQEPSLRGDVLVFLHRMFFILLLFCLGSVGALLLPKGAPRALCLRVSAGAFVSTIAGYLLLGAPPDAGRLEGIGGGLGGPLLWLLSYVFNQETHARLMLLLLATSALGLLAAFVLASRGPPRGVPPCALASNVGADKATLLAHQPWLSSLRKLFHFLLVLNLLLVVFSGLFSLLLMIVSGLLWLVIALELLRISRLSPRFSRLIGSAYANFTDSRDARGMVLSHIYLVLGVVAPLLAFASFKGAPGGPPSLLGIILVGCGDSVAALVGSRCSTPVLPFTTRKTVGGFIAFVISSLVFGFFLFPQVFPVS
ncbi:hypothetical protein ACSSS7_002131 [Eimeria intestinalis]